jgi:hypothetical protein
MGKAAGFDDVYNMTDDQLSTVKGLLEQLKPNILRFAQQLAGSVSLVGARWRMAVRILPCSAKDSGLPCRSRDRRPGGW